MSNISQSGEAYLVSPIDFHCEIFGKMTQGGDERAKDAWIWYFPGVHSKTHPLPHEIPDLSKTPLLSHRPPLDTSPRVGCRICWEQRQKWHTYKNVDGIVTNLRNHLTSEHLAIYEGYLANKEQSDALLPGRQRSESFAQPFTLEGFYERLVRWVVADDQVRIRFDI
jgi:hypothetical protein